MKPNEYIELVTKTEPTLDDYEKIIKRLTPQSMRLLHAAMGLCTEAGEFLDQLKKHIMYGKELDETNLAEELGDGNWYEAIAINELQRSFESIWERNIAKLKARYGDEFNEDDALNRDLENERNILVTGHSAMFCTHANEVPANCPCDSNCYCKTHTCKVKRLLHFVRDLNYFWCGVKTMDGISSSKLNYNTCKECREAIERQLTL